MSTGRQRFGRRFLRGTGLGMLALVALAWHEFGFHDNLEDPNDRGYDALRRLFLNVMAATLRTQTPNP